VSVTTAIWMDSGAICWLPTNPPMVVVPLPGIGLPCVT
jgi:hypothetical protein